MFSWLNPGKPIDAVLVNACECEPMLTADHRMLLEYADDIIYGLKAVMKTVAAPKGIIVIEENIIKKKEKADRRREEIAEAEQRAFQSSAKEQGTDGSQDA